MRSWSEETRFVRLAILTLGVPVGLEGCRTLSGNRRSRKAFHRPIRGPEQSGEDASAVPRDEDTPVPNPNMKKRIVLMGS